MKLVFYGLLSCFLLGIYACKSTYRLGHEDLSLYDKDFKPTIDFSGDSLRLFLPLGKYEINVTGFESYKGKLVLFELKEEERIVLAKEHLAYSMPQLTPSSVIRIDLFDLENQKRFRDILPLASENAAGITLKRQAANKEEFSIISQGYAAPKSQISVSDAEGSAQFTIKHFKQIYRPAPPPYADGNLSFKPQAKPSSQFSIAREEAFELKHPGLYLIQNKAGTESVFLTSYHEKYPAIDRVQQLILALRYVTTNEEFVQLNEAADQKLALDEYWLERTSSKERARILISAFYNRIEEANTFFTTYKEGWKTDRGMIYTIFGRPTEVEKYPDFEYWYYDYIEGRRNVSFFFDKENGQFLLRRSEALEIPWMEQIHIWRQGVVPN